MFFLHLFLKKNIIILLYRVLHSSMKCSLLCYLNLLCTQLKKYISSNESGFYQFLLGVPLMHTFLKIKFTCQEQMCFTTFCNSKKYFEYKFINISICILLFLNSLLSNIDNATSDFFSVSTVCFIFFTLCFQNVFHCVDALNRKQIFLSIQFKD